MQIRAMCATLKRSNDDLVCQDRAADKCADLRLVRCCNHCICTAILDGMLCHCLGQSSQSRHFRPQALSRLLTLEQLSLHQHFNKRTGAQGCIPVAEAIQLNT